MRAIHVPVLLAATLTAAACGPVDEAPETATRAVELIDATGQNRVTVLVTADDAAALDELALEEWVLTVGEGGLDAIDALAPVAADDDSPRSGLTVEVVDEQLEDGVDVIDVVEMTAPAWRAPFMWRYSYSYDDCTDVTRTSFWHKIYVSIWSKDTSSSGWSSMVSNRKLSNNETLSRCDNNSYRLKVGVEARKTSHYSVEFSE